MRPKPSVEITGFSFIAAGLSAMQLALLPGWWLSSLVLLVLAIAGLVVAWWLEGGGL